MSARGLIIAAPHSGAGKTTVTLALLAALMRRGIAVRAAKAGPDYIDPAFHAAATGAPSVNLDSWAMPAPLLDAMAAQAADGADIFVIEGVMGLFDGASTGARPARRDRRSRRAFSICPSCWCSTCRGRRNRRRPWCGALRRTIRRCALPASSSIASPASGIARLSPSYCGARHSGSRRRAARAALALPERHLGLVQAGEHPDLTALIERLAAMAERHLDLDAIVASAAPLTIVATQHRATPRAAARPAHCAGARSGVQLRLSAFARGVAAMPAPRSFRSRRLPTNRRPSAPTAAGCRAAIRSCMPTHSPRRSGFRDGLRRFAQTRPVHGECGGYMVLGQSIEDAAGQRHAMTGLLGHATSFAKRKLHLGYRTRAAFGRHRARPPRRDRARPRIPLRVADLGRRR